MTALFTFHQRQTGFIPARILCYHPTLYHLQFLRSCMSRSYLLEHYGSLASVCDILKIEASPYSLCPPACYNSRNTRRHHLVLSREMLINYPQETYKGKDNTLPCYEMY